MIPQLEEFDFYLKLQEMASMEFTGKLSISHRIEGRGMGQLLFRNGMIVRAEYQNKKSEVALFQIFVDQMRLVPMSYQQEPEVISAFEVVMELPIQKILPMMNKYLELHLKWQELRPPQYLKLTLATDFLSKEKQLSYPEYQLAGTLVDYHVVDEIYCYSPLHEYETSLALGAMRKKSFIKVIEEAT